MQLQEYYSPDDLDISELTAHFLDHDLEEADLQHDAPERWQVSEYSDFFNESYHDCNPDALTAK